MQMTHGSLFSGIGGFDLAAEWMGWENKFHCEWNPFGQRVLKHYWPNSESFTDITKTDFTKYANKIDILSGGFPCQPYSSAGKRLGKDDERHLWPEMLRAIREISPSFVVGENVRGLTNWNGGLVFEEVCAELESYGYQVAPVIIPACGVGAPHRRERVWFVAYSHSNAGRRRPCESGREEREANSNGQPEIYTRANSDGQKGNVADAECNGLEHWNKTGNLRIEETTPRSEGSTFANDFKANGNGAITNTKECGCGGGMCERCADGERELFQNKQERSEMGGKIKGHSGIGDVTNSSSGGIQRHGGSSQKGEFQTNESNQNNSKRQSRMDWENFPTKPSICGGDDGISRELDGIAFPKWRNESIKAYGNAIVPQVAYQIFKALELCK
jgi:DNA (cytosine-5)-methyltransferase 1